MIIAITGTPGTGKSSVAEYLKNMGFKVFSVKELAIKYKCYLDASLDLFKSDAFEETVETNSTEEENFNEIIVDIDKLKNILRESKESKKFEECIIEGHLSHHFSDIAIVLRCNPLVLKKRLLNRILKSGWDYEKVMENVEAELVDVVLIEATEICKKVYEIDTTNKKIEDVVSDVASIIKAIKDSNQDYARKFLPGKIDWMSAIGDKIDEVIRK